MVGNQDGHAGGSNIPREAITICAVDQVVVAAVVRVVAETK